MPTPDEAAKSAQEIKIYGGLTTVTYPCNGNLAEDAASAMKLYVETVINEGKSPFDGFVSVKLEHVRPGPVE